MTASGQAASQASRARELHGRLPIIDGHADTIHVLLEHEGLSLRENERSQFDLKRAQAGGLAAQVLTLWTAPEHYPAPLERALAMADRLHQELEAEAGQAFLILTRADLARLKPGGPLGILMAMEGGEPLRGGLPTLRAFYRLGLRLLGLTWNHRNALADGVAERDTGGGLTHFGRAVVAECNRLGIVIDLAHLSPAGFADALALSTQPVVFSHGNCSALFEHRRNLTDAQLKALADRGGLFGVSFVPAFLGGPATVERVADHIEHALQVIGPDHVALGSDFDGIDQPPAGLADISQLPNLTEVLLRRGLSEETLAKILGGNYLRLFSQVLPE